MDLNLPIVHPCDITPRKVGQQSILEAFVTSADTDLQFCLDRYCFEEIMDGDNQYHCSQCDCKRDAKRELTFQKLPPVLNVQLSRYVFDRVNFQKKKLSDKVLLPTVMQVKAKGKERKAEPVIHRYILCAVMRHKGTSAYSGHYVAEAMDWLTGQWFEFNDEKVTLLAEGPSCSYDPSASTGSNAKAQTATADGGKKGKTTSVSASQDAYNMYYVEESFLAQATLESLRPKALQTAHS
jgi:ubiquitin carboxyl-terminal hydrolase 48